MLPSSADPREQGEVNPRVDRRRIHRSPWSKLHTLCDTPDDLPTQAQTKVQTKPHGEAAAV